jgi:hypothetical protein
MHFVLTDRACNGFNDLALVFYFCFDNLHIYFFPRIKRIDDLDDTIWREIGCTIAFHPFFPIGFHLDFVFFHHCLSSAHKVTTMFE